MTSKLTKTPNILNQVQILDKTFEEFISLAAIRERLKEIAQDLNKDFAGKTPLVVGVLNGSFRIVAELVQYLDFSCEITFWRIKSYEGTSSTGNMQEIFSLVESVRGKDIIIIEDIIDTGNTLAYLYYKLMAQKPTSITVMSLLKKPAAVQKNIPAHHVGFEISNKFVIGYGLDYQGFGRNLNGIYILKE